jgi:hypothetical protein
MIESSHELEVLVLLFINRHHYFWLHIIKKRAFDTHLSESSYSPIPIPATVMVLSHFTY